MSFHVGIKKYQNRNRPMFHVPRMDKLTTQSGLKLREGQYSEFSDLMFFSLF